MLLNTDLHNTSLHATASGLHQRRMSAKEFVENLAELNDGHNFPAELLFSIYTAIKADPIQWVADDEEAAAGPNQENIYESEPEAAAADSAAAGGLDLQPSRPTALLSSTVNLSGQQSGGVNPFLTLPDTNSIDYKRGFVIR